MIGVVIVTHGSLASALLGTVELIMGKQEQVMAVAFEVGQAVVDLQTRVAEAVAQVDSGHGTLILVDILGGSPYNASAMLVMEQRNIEMITGVNLPMLFEVLPVRTGKLTSVADVALSGGCGGIAKFVMNRK
jgi:PTS system mannose-specific IIA component